MIFFMIKTKKLGKCSRRMPVQSVVMQNILTKKGNQLSLISFRELGGSRTHNRLIRSQGLYPIELPVQLISSAKIRLFLNHATKK